MFMQRQLLMPVHMPVYLYSRTSAVVVLFVWGLSLPASAALLACMASTTQQHGIICMRGPESAFSMQYGSQSAGNARTLIVWECVV